MCGRTAEISLLSGHDRGWYAIYVLCTYLYIRVGTVYCNGGEGELYAGTERFLRDDNKNNKYIVNMDMWSGQFFGWFM